MSHLIGQIVPGRLADLVLWKPDQFGQKPEMVVKGGLIAWAQVRPLAAESAFSDEGPKLTASAPPADGRGQRIHPHGPAHLRPADVGLHSRRRGPQLHHLGVSAVDRLGCASLASLSRAPRSRHRLTPTELLHLPAGTITKYGLKKRVEAVKGCRKVTKKDLKWNDLTPVMKGQSAPWLPAFSQSSQ